MKREKPYTFKSFVFKNKLQVYLNDNLWPEEIKFLRFIFFKKPLARDYSLIMHDTSKSKWINWTKRKLYYRLLSVNRL